ncbi:Zinc finger C-x8-C-x5-C-x3-H type family protein [Prunus dulcis]|uniref:Zinc finger C-x8-C-x5-C-x3-H type family protein n=1 Tax=Prunus dulcis TaxID=3755 RepID=A0A4Y1R501_PRUDU|nr:Zinc finger C-x8-C-x5-C-x3-H type family protein [Prunus dulcis]
MWSYMMRIAAFVSICAFSPIKEQSAYIIRSSSMITSPGLEASSVSSPCQLRQVLRRSLIPWAKQHPRL